MKEEGKKPDPCLHCAIIQLANDHMAAYGTPVGAVLEVLAVCAQQIWRAALGLEQYPAESGPPGSCSTH